jgi:hypothetical protein
MLRSQPSHVIRKYASLYKAAIDEGGVQADVEVGLGIVQLTQKLFPAALRTFERLLEKAPERADIYVYYCLALIGGRPVRKLRLVEATRIFELARTGAEIAEDPGVHYFLMLLIRHAYFKRNGVTAPEYASDVRMVEHIKNSSFAASEIMHLVTLIERNSEGNTFISSLLGGLACYNISTSNTLPTSPQRTA